MDAIYQEAVKTLLAIISVPLSIALTAVVVQLLRKLNLQVSAEQQAKIDYYVQLAIREVEEWAAQRLKAHKMPVTAGEKLERAVATVLDKVPGITRQEAIEIIHATLPAVGAGAVAALGEVRAAATNEVR